MNNYIRRICFNFVAALLLVVSALSAQARVDDKELSIDNIGAAEIEYNVQTYKSSTENLLAQNAYNAFRIEHQKKLMSITESAYSTQQIITVLIFVIVTILVFGGLWLSCLQFKADISKAQLKEDEKSKASFKVGKDGIEFSSSVIGLIVLFMSFFFFHLYVKDVYTIKTQKVEPLTLSTDIAVGDQTKK